MKEETLRNKVERLSGMMLAAEDLAGEIRREAEGDDHDKWLDMEIDISQSVSDIQTWLDDTEKPLPEVTPEEPPLMMQG